MDETFLPTEDDVLQTLDGDIHSQGLKINHRAWLDMGSEDWSETPDSVKAAAYQTAQSLSWEDAALANVMKNKYKHLSIESMDVTIKILKELAEKHPVEFEEIEQDTRPTNN